MELYDSPGAPTYHSPSKIAAHWNALTEQERREKCPRFTAPKKTTAKKSFPLRPSVGSVCNLLRLPTDALPALPGQKAMAARIVLRALWQARLDREVEEFCRAILAQRPQAAAAAGNGKADQSCETDASPAAGKYETDNEDRDLWIYEKCCAMVKYPAIAARLRKLCKKKKWEPIDSRGGLRLAATRYAERRGKPPIPVRQPGRPSK